MPRTWKEWLKIAEEMEQGLKAYGHVVMRVTSIQTYFWLGVLLIARARAVKDAKNSSLQPSMRGTAIQVDHAPCGTRTVANRATERLIEHT